MSFSRPKRAFSRRSLFPTRGVLSNPEKEVRDRREEKGLTEGLLSHSRTQALPKQLVPSPKDPPTQNERREGSDSSRGQGSS